MELSPNFNPSLQWYENLFGALMSGIFSSFPLTSAFDKLHILVTLFCLNVNLSINKGGIVQFQNNVQNLVGVICVGSQNYKSVEM